MRMVVLCCLFSASLQFSHNAQAVPTVVTNDCLRMIIPEDKIFRNEINFCFKIVCSNAFDNEINVLAPGIDVDEIRDFFAFDFQKVRTGDGLLEKLLSRDQPVISWASAINDAMVTPLQPNMVRTWTLHGWDIRSEDCAMCGVTNIACRVRTGEDSWLQSPYSVIKFINRDVSTNHVVFSRLLNSRNTVNPSATFNFKVYQDVIDGQRYYFSSGFTRLCAVSENDDPTFDVNNANMQLVITFPASRRVVKYSLHDSSVVEEPLNPLP